MKKFLIFFLIFSFFKINSFANDVGKGELILKKNIVAYFIKYIRGGGGKVPERFYLTRSGSYAIYWYCAYGNNNCGGAHDYVKTCKDKAYERIGKYEDCFMFAERRTVVWDNGNNFKYHDKTINSQWTDDRIEEKLKELGFLGDVSVNTSFNKSKNSELKFNKDDPNKTINDLKKITEMYQKGLLTKEEFEKSKNILLR